MSYRFQEILRMIIPGFYLISVLLLFYVFNNHNNLQSDNIVYIKELIKGSSNIVVIVLPFWGFIVGYIVECLMSFIEHVFYFLGGRRPSKTVLNGSSLYILDKRLEIIEQLNVDKALCNEQCNEALQKAKQKIGNTVCSEFYFTSIMARNIFGSQMIVFLFLLIWNADVQYCLLALFQCLLFFGYWVHKNHVYVKYVFAEYGRLPKNN